jgi:hypothetical protein
MDIYECPHCKNKIQVKADTKIAIYKYGGLGVRRLFGRQKKSRTGTMESTRKFKSEVLSLPQPKPTGFTRQPGFGSDLSIPGGITARRESADYMPTRESHVDVPWQQAIRNGLLWGGFILVGGVGGLWIASSVVSEISPNAFLDEINWLIRKIGWFKLSLTGLLSGITVMLWIARKDFNIQVENYSEAIHRLEEFSRQDINGDGYVGEPEQTPIEVDLPAPKGGKRKVYADLPGNRRKLVGFAWAVLHPNYAVNFSFYGAERTGYGKAAFGKLRDVFVDRQWAFVKDPSITNSELVLTREGKHVLYRLTQEAPEDLPEDVDLEGPEAPETQYGKFTEIDY